LHRTMLDIIPPVIVDGDSFALVEIGEGQHPSQSWAIVN
jgi:hypothetical protein